MYSLKSIHERLGSLTPEEIQQLFALVTENAELLNKIIPGSPLLNYVLGNTAVQNTNHPIIEQYSNWKTTQE